MKSVLLSSSAPIGPFQDLSKHGNGRNGKGRHYHPNPHMRDGFRRAARRAYSGAQLVLHKGMSVADAVEWTGSNANYVRAMITIIQSKDKVLLRAVLRGEVPVLVAAARVEGLVRLLTAFATASAETKVAFGETVGVETLFDTAIAPNIAKAAE
jgi:hypothetical protein